MSDTTSPDGRSGGGPWTGRGAERRGPNRVRRGDVQAAVLALLGESDMHGYQIIQELAGRSGGVWRPGAGSIYPTLRMLQEQGFVRSRTDGAKRVFSITDYGRRLAAESGSRVPWQDYATAEGPRVQLRRASESLLAAVSQVEATGTDAQVDRAAAILGAARRSVYLMLAEDDA